MAIDDKLKVQIYDNLVRDVRDMGLKGALLSLEDGRLFWQREPVFTAVMPSQFEQRVQQLAEGLRNTNKGVLVGLQGGGLAVFEEAVERTAPT
jgi:hypothetical protein